MLDEIRKAVRRVPFHPFWVELSSAESIAGPHPDHILPGRIFVAVEDDESVINILSALPIARIRWPERENTA